MNSAVVLLWYRISGRPGCTVKRSVCPGRGAVMPMYLGGGSTHKGADDDGDADERVDRMLRRAEGNL